MLDPPLPELLVPEPPLLPNPPPLPLALLPLALPLLVAVIPPLLVLPPRPPTDESVPASGGSYACVYHWVARAPLKPLLKSRRA